MDRKTWKPPYNRIKIICLKERIPQVDQLDPPNFNREFNKIEFYKKIESLNLFKYPIIKSQ